MLVTNLGAQGLRIAGVTLAGSDPADFAVSGDTCPGRWLAFGQSCTIQTRFTPAVTGVRSAQLTLQDNEPAAGSVVLSGTGVAANSGPAGPQGATGAAGADWRHRPAGSGRPCRSDRARGSARHPGSDPAGQLQAGHQDDPSARSQAHGPPAHLHDPGDLRHGDVYHDDRARPACPRRGALRDRQRPPGPADPARPAGDQTGPLYAEPARTPTASARSPPTTPSRSPDHGRHPRRTGRPGHHTRPPTPTVRPHAGTGQITRSRTAVKDAPRAGSG